MIKAIAPLLVVCLAGCSSLSQEDRERLTLFQQNAQLYYDGGQVDQALEQARKGLEIEPDDYKLLSVAGMCQLRLGNLTTADELFESVYEQRDPSDHRGHVLLGYGRTQQLLGNEHMRLAEVERSREARVDLTETERTLTTARADEHENRATAHWIEAERLYRELIDREELLRFAYKGLMEIDVEREDYAGAVEHGEACLTRNLTEQEVKRANIRETLSLEYERFERQHLEQLVDQETRVRAALAEMHYRQGRFTQAIEQLSALLALDPTRSTDYYNRARAYQQLGQTDDARRDFEKFLGTTKLPNGDERVANAYEFISQEG